MPETEEPNPRAVIGGNEPPLAEMLIAETPEMCQRAADLVGGIERAAVPDRDSAGRATLLVGMVMDHLDLIEKARDERGRPFLESWRTVNTHYHGIAGTLAVYDPKRKLIGGPLFDLKQKIETFRNAEKAAAEAERKRLADEAAQRQRLADEAAAKVAAAQTAAGPDAGRTRLAAELEQRQHQAAAETLQRRSEVVTAKPIDSGLGVKASDKKVTVVTITDLKKAAGYCLKVAQPEMRELIQRIYNRLAKAKVPLLPGAEIREETETTYRRAN